MCNMSQCDREAKHGQNQPEARKKDREKLQRVLDSRKKTS